MFFEISPVKVKKPSIAKLPKDDDSQKPEVLSLAPFSQLPKLFFENIKIGDYSTRKLIIKNSTNHQTTLFVRTTIPADFDVSMNWNQVSLEKDSEALFEISWTPTKEETARFTITFDDMKRCKRDVPIAFKSVDPTKLKMKSKAVKKRMSPVKKYYTSRPPHISPRRLMPRKKNSPQKRNLDPISPQKIFSSTKENIGLDLPSADFNNAFNRRETYILKKNDKSPLSNKTKNGKDSDENYFKLPTILVDNHDSVKPRKPLSFFNADNINLKSPKTPMLHENTFELKMRQIQSQFFSPGTPKLEMQLNLTSTAVKLPTFDTPNRQLLDDDIATYTFNANGETYIKDTSFETYIKQNLSTATYTKDISIGNLNHNFSASTCVKDNSIGNLASLNISPISNVKLQTLSPSPTLQSNNDIYSETERRKLSCIQEESRSSLHASRKRKSDLYFTFSSHTPKKANVKINGPVKRKNLSSQTDSSTHKMYIQNPYLLATTNSIDPFMTPDLYVDSDWVEKQEQDFKKWLNALLTPPTDLVSNEQVVDVSKLWQECKKRDVPAAPTKEMVCINYHTSNRMTTLRKAAMDLYTSPEISSVLSKVFQAVQQGKLMIREDKNVNLNISVKSQIIMLLLSYNSLWLRLGLETIYNEIIPLHSNSDIFGLSTFIINRLLKDPKLIKKYKSVHTASYNGELSKFFLKKFLALVYFLDQAKNRKLILHDPCLFNKNSTVKESRELLLSLAREVISSIGDITKYLKHFNYTVSHVQTYIHEFDYAVKNIGGDLRDGVRLARVMEIILMRNDLTTKLRVPAISRLQKVHNMKIVFDSLETAGFRILYDITPKDIVDGIWEKTLSFLWQIIYKFEAPYMVKKATIIQKWYRSLPIVLKRRRMEKERMRRENAAIKLQRWFRKCKILFKLNIFLNLLVKYLEYQRMKRAAIIIQSYYRRHRCLTRFVKLKHLTILLQSHCRGWLYRNVYRNEIRITRSVIIIQKCVKGFLLRRKYQQIKAATIFVQRKYRAKLLAITAKNNFNKLKNATKLLQIRYRAKLLMAKQRYDFLQLKSATIKLQQKYRANVLCKKERQEFLKIKWAAIHIQTWYRSVKLMKYNRQRFKLLKKTVSILEERYLALKLMKIERNKYQNLKLTTIKIQQHFRAVTAMRIQQSCYLKLKSATVILQRRFRAKISMERQRNNFVTLKKAAITIQTRYRAMIKMRIQRAQYIKMKSAAIKIQNWFRALIEMRRCYNQYMQLKKSVKIIETYFIAQKLMKIARNNYRNQKEAAVKIQRMFKATKAMKKSRDDFVRLRKACISTQRKFRANRMAKEMRTKYIQLKHAAIVFQRRFRAKQTMQICRKDYIKLKTTTIFIQEMYRAKTAMISAKTEYELLKEKCVFVQRRFRANRLAKKEHEKYVRLRQTTKFVQLHFRAKKSMQVCRNKFVELKSAAISIQRRYRAMVAMRTAKINYEVTKKACVLIQNKFRANRLAKKEHLYYIQLKQATITLQRRFRGKKCMELYRREFVELRTATVIIQRRYRARVAMRIAKMNYESTKKACIFVQNKFRANQLTKKERINYLKLKQATITIQQRFRAKKSMRICRMEFIKLKNAAIAVQGLYRAKVAMKRAKINYDLLRSNTIKLQRLFRARRDGRKQRERFLSLKKSVITIQQRWRANKQCQAERNKFIELKTAVIMIQKRWRNIRLGRIERRQFLKLRHHTIRIQRMWRGVMEMRKCKQEFLCKKQAVIKLQAFWKGYQYRKRNKQFEQIRQRLEIANKNYSEDLSLKARSENALRAFVSVNASISHIIDSLEHLEMCVKNSKELCKLMSRVLPPQLYIFLSKAARSFPEMKICISSVNILLTFYRYPRTRQNSFNSQYIKNILPLMMHWCDKESDIFPALCTLMWLFAENDEWKQIIVNVPNFQITLLKIGSLISRKASMVHKVPPKGTSLFAQYKNLPLPSVKPNWGLDKSNYNHIFRNSIQAFNVLSERLMS